MFYSSKCVCVLCTPSCILPLLALIDSFSFPLFSLFPLLSLNLTISFLFSLSFFLSLLYCYLPCTLTILPKAGEASIHEARICLHQNIGAESSTLHHSRTIWFDQHIYLVWSKYNWIDRKKLWWRYLLTSSRFPLSIPPLTQSPINTFEHSCLTIFTPSGFLRFTAIDRLPLPKQE